MAITRDIAQKEMAERTPLSEAMARVVEQESREDRLRMPVSEPAPYQSFRTGSGAEKAKPYDFAGLKSSSDDPGAAMSYVAAELIKKAQLFDERHAVYGDNYLRHGPIMALLMATQTLDPTDAQAMSRFGIFVQLVSKMTRYAENFNRGGHDDSLDDIAVYAMMLKRVDHTT